MWKWSLGPGRGGKAQRENTTSGCNIVLGAHRPGTARARRLVLNTRLSSIFLLHPSSASFSSSLQFTHLLELKCLFQVELYLWNKFFLSINFKTELSVKILTFFIVTLNIFREFFPDGNTSFFSLDYALETVFSATVCITLFLFEYYVHSNTAPVSARNHCCDSSVNVRCKHLAMSY